MQARDLKGLVLMERVASIPTRQRTSTSSRVLKALELDGGAFKRGDEGVGVGLGELFA